jgi:hypothetical protein
MAGLKSFPSVPGRDSREQPVCRIDGPVSLTSGAPRLKFGDVGRKLRREPAQSRIFRLESGQSAGAVGRFRVANRHESPRQGPGCREATRADATSM